MNEELEDLKKRKAKGHQIFPPHQGIHKVHKGMAETMKLPFSEPEEWFWVNLTDPDKGNQAYVFPFKHQATWDYMEEWRRSLLNWTRYALNLEVSFFQLGIFSQGEDNTKLKILDLQDLANAIKNKLNCDVQISEVVSTHLLIKYESQSKDPDVNIQNSEIELFRSSLNNYLTAISIYLDLGFSYINIKFIYPETFWEATDAPFRLKVDTKALDKISQMINGSEKVTRYSEMLVTINSLASHRAQIIYGFECIKDCLKERIDIKQKDLFDFKPSQKKGLLRAILKSVNKWSRASAIEISKLQISHIEDIVRKSYKSVTPKYKDALYQELESLELGIKDLKCDFEQLLKMRGELAHCPSNNFSAVQYKKSMELIRKFLIKLILISHK
jgi:hypothetical protein